MTVDDGPQTAWRLEYSGPRGITQPAPVGTTGSGTERAATFDVPEMHVTAAFCDRMDFRLTVLGENDLTV